MQQMLCSAHQWLTPISTIMSSKHMGIWEGIIRATLRHYSWIQGDFLLDAEDGTHVLTVECGGAHLCGGAAV